MVTLVESEQLVDGWKGNRLSTSASLDDIRQGCVHAHGSMRAHWACRRSVEGAVCCSGHGSLKLQHYFYATGDNVCLFSCTDRNLQIILHEVIQS